MGIPIVVAVAVAACGDSRSSQPMTPEQAIAGANDGDRVTVVGDVHTVTYDSMQDPARAVQLAQHPDRVAFIADEDDEEARGQAFAFDDTGAKYPRTPDAYVLIRTVTPDDITVGVPGFNAGRLQPAWGLGIHVTDVDGAHPLPEIGATLKVTGTFHRIHWNQRTGDVPILDDATVEVVAAPAPLAGPGDSCDVDQACNARLVCARATHTCAPPPREIYWADPWHDVNGACDTDDDCPLGQTCDARYAMTATGTFAAHYFASVDVGRHICVLADGATVASQCPRIYTTRDLVGGRFVTGKEVCVHATLFLATVPEDMDTHDQMAVDQPIPYPTADAEYQVFGGTTENGPIYKDPARPGGALADPAQGQEVIAIGTYRYDPDHGWYEVHPVKAYLPPP